MTTVNLTIVTNAWTKVANASDIDFLVTWDTPRFVEFASTELDIPPSIKGHKVSKEKPLTREELGAGYVWAKLVPDGSSNSIQITLSKTTSDEVSFNASSKDASGRVRTSNITTLSDGKVLGNVEDTFKWDVQGTGISSVANNSVTLSVTSGQYLVRQSRHWNQYYSGKPQQIENTDINFQNEAGVIKRVGYFSSSAVAPYTTSLDGVYIESDGVNNTYRLVTSRNGTETHNIPWTDWNFYSEVSNYDWSKFKVTEIDFLWLGGAVLRLFMVVNGVFTLIHTIDNHAGYQDGLIMHSPNQPVRYEIRGISGSGSYTTVCSQVASEGAGSEEGNELSVYTQTAITANAVGTIYAIKGVRKSATHRYCHVDLASLGISIVSASTDSGLLLAILNPTLSAPLTWAANSRIEEGTATTQTITAGTGRILAAVPMNSSGAAVAALNAGLRSLPIGIANDAGQVVLAYMPTSINQSVIGQISVIES